MSKTNSLSFNPIGIIPSRLLAALIDYLVFSAFSSLCARSGIPFDKVFIGTFIIGALYFGIGNSRWSNGQTLGKRAFGIQVYHQSSLLTLRRSFFRYFLSIGIVILIVEIPQLYFRTHGISASLTITELPTLLAINLLSIQFACLFSSRGNLGLHDFFATTQVVRTESQTRSTLSRKTFFLWLLASGFTSTVWFAQLQLPPKARQIYEHRFVLEHRLPIRVLQVSEDETACEIRVLVIESTKDRELLVNQLTKDLDSFIETIPRSAEAGLKPLRFFFHFEDSQDIVERNSLHQTKSPM